MPAGEVSDHEAAIVAPLCIFGMGVRMLKVHFLIEVELEQRGTYICCLEEKTLIVERSFGITFLREYLGTYLQPRLHYLDLVKTEPSKTAPSRGK